MLDYNTTLFPSVNVIALGGFDGVKYTHHTFTPSVKQQNKLIMTEFVSRANVCIKLRPDICRTLFSHAIYLVLPVPSSKCEPSVSELGENTDKKRSDEGLFRSPEKQASLRWVRTRSKSTLTNGHFAMQRPLSGAGCQKHSTKQRTLRLFGGSNQVSLAHPFFFTPHPFPHS